MPTRLQRYTRKGNRVWQSRFDWHGTGGTNDRFTELSSPIRGRLGMDDLLKYWARSIP